MSHAGSGKGQFRLNAAWKAHLVGGAYKQETHKDCSIITFVFFFYITGLVKCHFGKSVSLSKVSVKRAMKQYFFVSVLKFTSQGRLLNRVLCNVKKELLFISCRWEAFSNTRVQKVPARNRLLS